MITLTCLVIVMPILAIFIPPSGANSGAVFAAATGQEEVRLEEHWDVQPSGVGDDLKDVTFVSPTVGWAVGSNNTIIKTTDGGWTWQRQVERREGGPDFREVTMLNENE